ncbi:MAG: NAD(P)H-hydrate dehydratase [Gemmatimonadota bacterium]
MNDSTIPTPWAHGDVRAQSAEEARAFDAHAIEHLRVPERVLMENAGRSTAAIVDALYPGVPVVALVGAGNNGGDALVALRSLLAWGRSVRAVLVADRDANDPLLHGWPVPVDVDTELDDTAWELLLSDAGVVIDGILGTGTRGAPRARQAAAIDRLTRSGRPVVAVDVPSGIDATSGAVEGAAVRAEVTVAFGAPKLGALLHPARARVGRHIVVEIGFPPFTDDAGRVHVVSPSWALPRLPMRSTDTHKNREGRVLVVGGQRGMAGAALLAARAAFRAGAGVVRVASVEENRVAIQSGLPEAMFVRLDDQAELSLALDASDAVVVGPGLGRSEDAEAALRTVLERAEVPILLDADALNVAAEGRVPRPWSTDPSAVLVTPHPGEMERLLPDVTGSPVVRARAAAARLGCVVLLKGAPSVVASADGVWIDTQSSSDLAVAGMGDTLAGVCGALLAHGVGADEAGALGLYLSGRAARLAALGPGLTPTDVIDHLPSARQEHPAERAPLDLPFVVFDAEPAQ